MHQVRAQRVLYMLPLEDGASSGSKSYQMSLGMDGVFVLGLASVALQGCCQPKPDEGQVVLELCCLSRVQSLQGCLAPQQHTKRHTLGIIFFLFAFCLATSLGKDFCIRHWYSPCCGSWLVLGLGWAGRRELSQPVLLVCTQMAILPVDKDLKPEPAEAARHVKLIREEQEGKANLSLILWLWVEEDWKLIPSPCDSVYGFILH